MAFIKNLKYKIENFVLDIPSLEIKDNEVTVLMGPSGAGKSTLFNLITGFIKYSDWQFEINGVDLAKKEISDRELGVVFQSFELFPHLTARENIELVMQSRKNNGAQAIADLEKFKNILSLTNCWNTKAQVLSGGEKQRVALLRAVMAKPRMLLLDEPFSALDLANKEEARKLVKSVLTEFKITTLLISHDTKDAQYFGPNLVLIDNGQIRPASS
ncbi:thiamine ABC transporter ATP-binding protein [Bdellovibrio sp. qaytius]|nr:thiamine ABC transporter ATP-binding protein [Bdellovibrio sp. qaytius]